MKISVYSKEETKIIGQYDALPRTPYAPRYNTPITPRENYELLFARKQPVWIPMGTDSVGITPRICPDTLARGFAFEAVPMLDNERGGPDMFGIKWEYITSVGGSMVRPGEPRLTDIENWENYITFPDIDSWDWAGNSAANKKFMNTERPLKITILNGLFERLISFMDFENAAMALIDEDQQVGVHRLFDKLADLYIRLIKKYKEYYHIDMICLHDDWGSQRAPFFSLNTVREMIAPYLKRVADATHELGLIFELHSCGKIELLVPAMIESNVDLWGGQPMNDKKMLIDKYGDKIVIGVAPPVTTPDMSDAEVMKLAENFMADFYHGGRVMVSMMRAEEDDRLRNYLYELSRKEYDKANA